MATHNNLKGMVRTSHTANCCFLLDWRLVEMNSEMEVSQPGVNLQLLGLRCDTPALLCESQTKSGNQQARMKGGSPSFINISCLIIVSESLLETLK